MVHFSITKKELSDLNETRDINDLNELGGVPRIVEALHTDPVNGLGDAEANEGFVDRKREYVVSRFFCLSTYFLSKPFTVKYPHRRTNHHWMITTTPCGVQFVRITSSLHPHNTNPDDRLHFLMPTNQLCTQSVNRHTSHIHIDTLTHMHTHTCENN